MTGLLVDDAIIILQSLLGNKLIEVRKMNRDEILSKSREENKYFDEMMIDTIIKSGKASS
ncbi:hypothetical protein [Anaerococcus porci]|uniref:hypothetical protein n=1 Tax=Anaerococcus porci TaxID=2652269 RepID=UPI001E498726|nr:hypothetical protein [Anaerococcus porci]